MSTKIFLNLPVKDVAAAQRFYTELGYSVNPQFTGEDSTCLVISEHITAMLLADKALAAGGSEPKAPQDHGFMYVRSFTDLDGHHWELIAQGQG